MLRSSSMFSLALGLIPRALLADSYGDSGIAAGVIQGGAKDSRHAVNSKIARGLFGRGASGAGPRVEDCRWLLSLAAVRDGMDRGAVAKAGGMDRQTLHDWVHRFNAFGPEGLIDNWTQGPNPRLAADQLAEGRRSSRLVRIARRTALAADRPEARHRRAVRMAQPLA